MGSTDPESKVLPGRPQRGDLQPVHSCLTLILSACVRGHTLSAADELMVKANELRNQNIGRR